MGLKSVRAASAATSVVALVLLTACGNGSDSGGGEIGDEIAIGVALPTTGGSAVLGEPMTHGIEMAVAEINEEGGVDGAQVKITQEDLGADDTDALNAFNRLTSENPAAIIGFPVSTQGFAVATQVDRTGIPVVMGGTNSRLAGISDWVFSMTASDAITTTAAAEFAVETLGVERIGLLRESGELGTGASEVLTAASEDLGFEIVQEEIFQSGDVDLSTQANALRNSDAEMLFVYGQQADYIVVANAFAAAGLKLPTFIAGLQPGTYAELNYDGFETIYTRNQCRPSSDAEGRLGEWATQYEEEFGTPPTEYAAIAYDGMHLLADAIAEAGSTEPEAIRDALTNMPETEGVCGVHVGTEEGALSFGVTIGHFEGEAYVADEQLTVLP
jgi:branched-chain amino acid transport system substrate-binding protein